MTRLDIVICAYETRGALSLPAGVRRSSHSLERFKGMGLALGRSKKPLWHNGDYPLFTNALDADFDPLIMVEYDMHIGVPLDPVIGKIQKRRLDFVAPKLSRRPPPGIGNPR